MQRLILALALPTNVVHGFLSWGGDFGTTASSGGPRTRNRVMCTNQPFVRPDMGIARDLIR